MAEYRTIDPHSQTIFSRSNDGIGFSGIQRKSAISEPGDRYEIEADRIADEVVNQDRARNASFIHHSGLPLLQRQEQSSPQPSKEEQYKNAAEKAGEAFLKTDLGRDIKDKALKQGKDFISTLRGKIITGAAAAAVVSTLAATNSKLPMQVPEIPLDFITPGLKVKLNYEGPVRNPTSASLTFTYVEQVQKKEKKGEPTEREKFRAETARMAEDQARFREGLKTPEQRAAEHDQFMNAYWGRKNRLGLDPIRTPGLVDDEGNKPALRMRDVRPKREEEGLQRKAEESKPLEKIPPIVHEVLRSPGQPLEPDTRAFMEGRFGYDFSRVKVHTESMAAKSAREVNALAYTIGRDIVFGERQYDTSTSDGLKLLAHEMTHVIQQGESARFASRGIVRQDSANKNTMEVVSGDKMLGRASVMGKMPNNHEMPYKVRLSSIASPTSGIILQRQVIYKRQATRDEARLPLQTFDNTVADIKKQMANVTGPEANDLRDATAMLDSLRTSGRVTCWFVEGSAYASYDNATSEIRLHINIGDAAGSPVSVIHEAIHAVHAARYPRLSQIYAQVLAEGGTTNQSVGILLNKWLAWTEYWAYHRQIDLTNAGLTPDLKIDAHKYAMDRPKVRSSIRKVMDETKEDFDPSNWTPPEASSGGSASPTQANKSKQKRD